MKINNIAHIKDCVDGTQIKEFLLDENINDNFIKYLISFGESEYMGNLKNAFFKVEKAGKFVIKGVENTNILRITLEKDVKENEQEVKRLIINFEDKTG